MYTNILYLPSNKWSISMKITDHIEAESYPKARRKVLAKYKDTFDYNDYDVVGYLIGGELTLEKPDRHTRKLFAGDWSKVTKKDVWEMIHNFNRDPVTFWETSTKFTTYYPTKDECVFTVVECEII